MIFVLSAQAGGGYAASLHAGSAAPGLEEPHFVKPLAVALVDPFFAVIGFLIEPPLDVLRAALIGEFEFKLSDDLEPLP